MPTTNTRIPYEGRHEEPATGARVATRLIEAAWCAHEGNNEGARAHIAHAVALLQGSSQPLPILASVSPDVATRGRFARWQARRIVAYINANLTSNVGIDDLSALLGLSASHFGRAFKCTFGVPPHVYLIRRRIEFAQTLMLTTNEPLSAIALLCGMSDQSHFTRWFRRVVGETPFAWRRGRRGTLGAEEHTFA